MAANKKSVETMTVDLGTMLDAGASAIVTLVAGETRLAAHKAVLVDRSPVFAAMFRHDLLEASTGEVTIADVEGPVLRQLLAYMYTLAAPQLPDMAPQLLAAADKYGLSALKAACEQQVAQQLAVKNAASIAALAVRHGCDSLRQTAITFIKEHTYQVMSTQGWAGTIRTQPEDAVEVSRLIAEEPTAEIRSLSEDEKVKRLIQAAEKGDTEELQMLLVAGVDVNAEGDGKWTALHKAAENGHMEAVKKLLDRGAEVGLRKGWRYTALHRAAKYGHMPVVQLLLASPADPEANGNDGRTPLHDAADRGHAEVAAALLQAGADRAAKDDKGKTPLDLAREQKRQQLVDILT